MRYDHLQRIYVLVNDSDEDEVLVIAGSFEVAIPAHGRFMVSDVLLMNLRTTQGMPLFQIKNRCQDCGDKIKAPAVICSTCLAARMARRQQMAAFQHQQALPLGGRCVMCGAAFIAGEVLYYGSNGYTCARCINPHLASVAGVATGAQGMWRAQNVTYLHGYSTQAAPGYSPGFPPSFAPNWRPSSPQNSVPPVNKPAVDPAKLWLEERYERYKVNRDLRVLEEVILKRAGESKLKDRDYADYDKYQKLMKLAGDSAATDGEKTNAERLARPIAERLAAYEEEPRAKRSDAP